MASRHLRRVSAHREHCDVHHRQAAAGIELCGLDDHPVRVRRRSRSSGLCGRMTDEALDELGPVDLVVVEFPPDRATFTGEMVDELVKLTEAGTIRVMDILVLTKDEDGGVEAMELDALDDVAPLQALDIEVADFLAASDIENLAAAMVPGSVAGVLVYENLWAAPFASAARRSGGQLIAQERIPVQAIIAAIEADAELEAQGA
jgi:hypothetical protein